MSSIDFRVGIPSKGRLCDQTAELLKQAGFRFRRRERGLFARVGDLPIDLVFLRPKDIPVLCAEGALDMGITGTDCIAEAQVDLLERLRLEFGECRLAVCVPETSRVSDVAQLAAKRIATSFPHMTEAYLAQHQISAHLVTLSGSVEIMATLGVADAVVDLVETGSTLAANGLSLLAEIAKSETVLVQSKSSVDIELANRITRRVEGVVIARAFSLLEYNVARHQLTEAEQITPGFNSPTVSALEDAHWCAVRVMVKKRELVDVMERLEALGASAIVETNITNCRL